ncbi:MAG: 4Fe-4S single cluster domain-containing protein [Peptostreptococcaceae bacterium]
MIRISHFVKSTKVLGPGSRFCIWFQGCNKRCNGCINEEGQDINGGFDIKLNDLFEKIKNENSITGITISGGEPFLQKDKLLEFINIIKKETKLDIMIYSGYLYEDLINDSISKEILSKIDIFVDGEYIESKNEDQLYRGSSNQNIYILSEKYKSFETMIKSSNNRNIEFQVLDNEELFMVGIPPKGFYDEFINKIRERI